MGDGSARAGLEEQVRASGLGGKVVFTGLVAPGEVPRLVAVMDCLAHLSYREALSRALPQALAAGKPVVAYDFDGADEICIEGETGFLVHTGDVPAVTQRLAELAANPALRERFGKRGQAMVREQFPVEHMLDQLYQLYQKLLARELST